MKKTLFCILVFLLCLYIVNGEVFIQDHMENHSFAQWPTFDGCSFADVGVDTDAPINGTHSMRHDPINGSPGDDGCLRNRFNASVNNKVGTSHNVSFQWDIIVNSNWFKIGVGEVVWAQGGGTGNDGTIYVPDTSNPYALTFSGVSSGCSCNTQCNITIEHTALSATSTNLTLHVFDEGTHCQFSHEDAVAISAWGYWQGSNSDEGSEHYTDDLKVYNRTDAPVASTLNITSINFTSESPETLCPAHPTNCANTTDETPTFEPITNIVAQQCRISTSNESFSAMAQNCTTSDNTTWSCTQATNLSLGEHTLYMACNSSDSAVEQSGMIGPLNLESKVNINIINRDPNVTLISPTNGAFIDSNTTPFVFNVTDDDSDGLDCNLRINGTSQVGTGSLAQNKSVTKTLPNQLKVNGSTEFFIGNFSWTVQCCDGTNCINSSPHWSGTFYHPTIVYCSNETVGRIPDCSIFVLDMDNQTIIANGTTNSTGSVEFNISTCGNYSYGGYMKNGTPNRDGDLDPVEVCGD